jgi:hypothetical protein
VRGCPNDPEILINISTCRYHLGDFTGAEKAAHSAVALDPDRPGGYAALALTLFSQDRRAEALAAHRDAVSRDDAGGSSLECFANFGAFLFACGDAEAARDLFERYLHAHPNPLAHSHYGFALLTLGDFDSGWANYAFRWFQDPMRAARPGYHIPTWSGQPLDGKTVLLWAEQGIGDVIQFARFSSQFKARGARVLLQVHPNMDVLGGRFSDIDRAFSSGEAFTAFDYHLPLMSAPGALGTDVASIPDRVPYLACDPDRLTAWAPRFQDVAGRKIGLAWSGNPSHCSRQVPINPPERAGAVVDCPGRTYFSLQKQPRESDLLTSRRRT